MLRIGVIGQSGEISEEAAKLAEEVGREIAKKGAVLLTGGTSGVMDAVSYGAKQQGGLVIGILPGDSLDCANDNIDIPITTGFGYDYRSLILVHSSDALIMVSGGNGTLGELSAAYLNQKPVVVVEPSGGWAGRVREIAYDGSYLDMRKTVKIGYASTAQEAVAMALESIPPRKCKQQIDTGKVDGM
ncbi:TIGR00725 family protein [Dendrosporobacter sp. 1207_IL3150]|uniref:TIGR00725 family protein n=1 Tax=Dendrosporobacter sp. 1207_IL3150 TaxID=3084054 RepID=UPI002FDB0BB1